MGAGDYLRTRPFPPDPFQWEAGEALDAGRSVVVTAPTGSGKTVVAETAIHLARERGRRVFYTTPIKALSNQKFGDLAADHGRENVGLLTGDNVINGDAPIVVMTTEVLRNMIYTDEAGLADVELVILDEVHYLQDPFRGGVWEEVIIHAPRHVRLVCLSATIANAEELTAWVRERRGPTELVVAAERPVPLESMYLVADRVGPERLVLLPTFVRRDGGPRPNPRILRLLGTESPRRRRFSTPGRVEVVEKLAEEGMLPAIYFIFSRAGCEAAANVVVDAGLRLIGPDEREEVRRIAEERTAHLSDADLAALDYGRWLTALEHGVAPHHAGMVPAFKETVEAVFAAGLLRVVFATETLALGINMPARTVVLETLTKFTGDGHALLEPGDYTQLMGRAGRRGIDTQGYGIVLYSRFVRFEQVAQVAAAGSHPLRSSFRPTYNMAANLVANYPEDEARRLLVASFGEFQRASGRAGREEALARLEAQLADELARAECHLGSVADYVAARDRAPRGEGVAAHAHPGDVLDVPAGPRAGRFVVVRRLETAKGGVRLLVLGTSGRSSTLGERELVGGTEIVGRVELPGPYRGRDRRYEQEAVRALRGLRPVPRRPEPPSVPDHPVARCPDAEHHVTWFRKAARTARRVEQLRAAPTRAGGLVEELEAIRALLAEWGYLEGWALTPRGRRLRLVYNELDLLLTEAVERGLFWGLAPEEIVALASTFVYEPRTDVPAEAAYPTALLAERFRQLVLLHGELERAERTHRLPPSRPPEAGFMAPAYAWARAEALGDLPGPGMQAGDFVRVCRQLVDLLRQLRDVYPELDADLREGIRLIDRGVVAAQGVG